MYISDYLKKITNKYKLEIIGVSICGLLICISAVFIYVSFIRQTETVIEIQPKSAILGTSKKTNEYLLIDVSGSVVSPNVYKIKPGSLLIDVLNKAGGLSQQADYPFIARNFNLSLPVVNNQKIHFPSLTETQSGIFVEDTRKIQYLSIIADTSETNESSLHDRSKISINTADKTSLDSLPGVGTVTADKIIQNRPFTSTQELVDKKILSQNKLNDISELIDL